MVAQPDLHTMEYTKQLLSTMNHLSTALAVRDDVEAADRRAAIGKLKVQVTQCTEGGVVDEIKIEFHAEE